MLPEQLGHVPKSGVQQMLLLVIQLVNADALVAISETSMRRERKRSADYQIQFRISMKMAGPAGRGFVSPNLAARTADRSKGLMNEASHIFRIAETFFASV